MHNQAYNKDNDLKEKSKDYWRDAPGLAWLQENNFSLLATWCLWTIVPLRLAPLRVLILAP
jgi:hypothetical protein